MHRRTSPRHTHAETVCEHAVCMYVCMYVCVCVCVCVWLCAPHMSPTNMPCYPLILLLIFMRIASSL